VEGPPPGVLSKLNGASTAENIVIYRGTSNGQNICLPPMVTKSDPLGVAQSCVHSKDQVLDATKDVLRFLIMRRLGTRGAFHDATNVGGDKAFSCGTGDYKPIEFIGRK
jgi:hypothetical protein